MSSVVGCEWLCLGVFALHCTALHCTALLKVGGHKEGFTYKDLDRDPIVGAAGEGGMPKREPCELPSPIRVRRRSFSVNSTTAVYYGTGTAPSLCSFDFSQDDDDVDFCLGVYAPNQ